MEDHEIEGLAKVDQKLVPKKIEPEQVQKFKNEFDVGGMLATAGSLNLSPKEKEKLFSPIDDGNIEIRPDGLIYAPWMEYASRLREVFGTEWALIPNGMFEMSGNHIYWGFWLIVRGHLVSYALGDQEWRPDNYTMSKSDAVEGAWSNALMRNCKHMGISLELWKPSFIKAWKSLHAESYKGKDRQGKEKIFWRKKVSPVNNNDPQVDDIIPDEEELNTTHGETHEDIKSGTFPTTKEEPIKKWWEGQKLITEAQGKMLYAKMKNKGMPTEDLAEHFKLDFYKHLPYEYMTDALNYIDKQPRKEQAS